MKKKSYLLATDLDHTLVGDPSSIQSLFELFDQRPDNTAIVYVTGRHLQSAQQLINQEQLPIPDLLVTDVGTVIYDTLKEQEDTEWRDDVLKNWMPEAILETAKQFPSLKRQQLPNNRRISFYVHSPETVKRFEEKLTARRIPHHLVYSSGRDLDILPERSGKGKAVDYIMRRFANDQVKPLIAGDSGNDEEMLSLGYPAVIVGNAKPELDTLPAHPALYRAAGHYAKGIQEAWMHFYPEYSKSPIGT